MKNLHLSWLFLLLFCLNSYSQELTIGVKGGFNKNSIGDLNSIGASFQTGHPDEIFSPEDKFAAQYGVFIKIDFNRIFLKGELNFMTLKNDYNFPDRVSFWKSSTFEIPVLAGYNIYKPLNLYTGLVFSSVSDLTLDGVEFAPITYEKTAMYYSVGVLLDFGRFGFDLRYQKNLKTTPQQRVNIDYSDYGVNKADLYEYKQSQIILTAHINIFRTDKEKMSGFLSGLFKGNDCKCPY